jgi:putative ABC transport system ATP-binding protein
VRDSSPPLLEFRDVRKCFRTGDDVVRAVDGLSLVVARGQLVALYGPSGSGKSTLLRVAAAIEPPDSGAVLVDGRDVTSLSDRDASHYRLHVLGWINQQSDLIGGVTALDNAAIKPLAALGSMKRARRSVTPLLERLGLGERLDHRAETLSMGERQRVMIARALALDPSVVLADEPTGNLDSRRSREVFELLRDETHERGLATLLVTHDERATAFADKVYSLQDGVLVDAGPEAVPVS